MKLKMKEWMEKVTKAVKPATATTVSMPFTPPCNGLLLVVLRADAAGRTYAIYTNAAPSIVDFNQIRQGYGTGALFVEKGKQVKISESYNLAQHIYNFIPLVGGVLRNPVIARLTAIFTSLLFGGDVNEDETETSPDKDTGKSSKTGNDNRHYHLIRSVAHTQCLPEQAINGDVQKRGTCNDDIQARCLISHGRSHRIGVDIRSVCKSGCNYNGLDNWLTISERRWAA